MNRDGRCGKAAVRAGGPSLRATYAAGAAMCAAYAVWGSLFPFDFHRVPFAALHRFWHTWPGAGTGWSLTDLVSNVLLFLPIGLFFAALVEKFWPDRGAGWRAVAAVLAAGTLSSLGLEIGQLFVSDRTASLADVAAEAIGTAAGIALWRAVGAELDAVIRRIGATLARATVTERLLVIYGVVFAIAWWLPADFTLRPGEIADKFEHKRLLLPFTPSPDAASPVGLAVTAAAALPLGLATAWCGLEAGTRRSVARAAIVAALLLAVLEVGQVPVFSRTTDGTAFLAAVAGGLTGAAASRFANRPRVLPVRLPAMRAWMPVVAWLAVTTMSQWWPFHFVLDRGRASAQTMSWSASPFRLPATLFDVWPGVLLAAGAGLLMRPRVTGTFARLHALILIGCASALFLVFEIGRVLLVNGRPTLLPVLLNVAALGTGLCAGRPRFLVRREVG